MPQNWTRLYLFLAQQAETQPIDTPDAGAAAGDADPTADAASNDDDAAMTPPAAADESDDQTENQQQNQLQNPLPVTGTVPPLQATTTPSPSLLAGAPPQPEAAQPEAAPAEDEAASGEGSGKQIQLKQTKFWALALFWLNPHRITSIKRTVESRHLCKSKAVSIFLTAYIEEKRFLRCLSSNREYLTALTSKNILNCINYLL